ncbi:MAG: Rab family GTPase [Candidatus Heimdallarchaeota archaeon]
MKQPTGSLKIVLCGDPEVGKTTLRRKFMGKSFRTTYKPTIGVDFALKEFSLRDDDRTCQLQIWDLGSQEAFKSVRKIYYRSACGAMLLFDITNPKSCENLSIWMNEIWENTGFGIIPVILIGNKVDLRNSMENTVDPCFGDQYAQEQSACTKQHGFQVQYLETSAKTGEHVEKAFELLVGKIVTRFGLDRTEKPINSSSRRKKPLTTQTHPEGEVRSFKTFK